MNILRYIICMYAIPILTYHDLLYSGLFWQDETLIQTHTRKAYRCYLYITDNIMNEMHSKTFYVNMTRFCQVETVFGNKPREDFGTS